jgi:hypothetical protein
MTIDNDSIIMIMPVILNNYLAFEENGGIE